MCIECPKDPTSIKQALRSECWESGIADEINALAENGTWEVKNLPPEKNAVDSKWTFRIKRNSNGEIKRYIQWAYLQ